MKSKSDIVEKNDKNGKLIYRINKKTKKGNYYISETDSYGNEPYQRQFLHEIHLDGFQKLPSGLYQNGNGFTKAGMRIIQEISQKSKLKTVTVSANSASSFSTGILVINQKDLQKIGATVRRIDIQKANEIKGEIKQFLGKTYPRTFSATSATSSYSPGFIASLLKDESILRDLSSADKESILAINPSLIQDQKFTLKSPQKLKIITDGIDLSKKIYLEKVIEEYDSKLKINSDEHSWQQFLKDHILTLLNTYVAVIEKQSICIGGKYPDFLLIDAYGYADIYEIKKPQTKVLKYDKGRGNYYWSSDLAMAISQTEKYLEEVNKNGLQIADLIRKSKGKSVTFLRPRGYIVVGKRSQLSGEDMQNDFRILNDSLKNIDILFFDDLLGNIKILLERMTLANP